jgi:hypothetical protein
MFALLNYDQSARQYVHRHFLHDYTNDTSLHLLHLMQLESGPRELNFKVILASPAKPAYQLVLKSH